MVVDASNGNPNADVSKVRNPERRRRERFRAQWRVRFWKPSGEAVEALTVDVSSDGFYCRCSQQFSEDDRLSAILEIPGAGADADLHKLALSCEVQVLRVKTLAGGREWGLAVRILDYSVAAPPRGLEGKG
jgi:hypothetical protein